MRRTLAAALIAVVCSITTLVAQNAPAAQTDEPKPTHGIIRKARPKTAEPVKQPPVATTDAAAAAIAAAVRSAEETKKAAPPQRPRAARPTETRAARRRYLVKWPSQRLEVKWDTPDERVTLSWQVSEP